MARRAPQAWATAVIAALLAAAALLLYFLSGESVPPGAPTGGPPADAPAAPTAPVPERAAPPAPSDTEPADAESAGPATVARLRVVVTTAGGEPVRAATVEVSGEPLVAMAAADGEGVARFESESAGDVEVLVRAPGHVRSASEAKFEVGAETEARVTLVAGVAVEGRVLDEESGSPVEDASVRAVEGGSSGGRSSLSMAPPLGSARTGADGRFRLDGLPPDAMATLVASSPRHARASMTVVAGGLADPVTLRLPPAGVVRGRVLDRDGGTVSGARVYLVPADATMLLENPGGTTVSSDRGLQTSLRATSGPDGAFAVESVPLDAEFFALAQADGHATSEPIAGVRVTRIAREREVDLVLRRRGAIEVVVLTDAGAPVSGAAVQARLHFLTHEGETDAAGRLLLDGLDLGPWVVTVSKSGLPGAKRAYEVEEGKTVRFEVRLAQPCAIDGLVVDDLGEPQPGMRVHAFRPTWEDAYEGLPECEADGVSDERGRFRVEGLLPGPYTLWAQPTGRPVRGELGGVTAPSAGVRLVAPRLGRLRFSFAVPDGVEPPEDVRVNVDSLVHTVPWAAGPSEIRDVRAMSTTLKFRAKGFVGFDRDVTVVPGEVTELGVLALDPGHALDGRVEDASGAAVAGAEVSAGDSFTPTFQQVTTDAEGRFRLEHLADGENEVRVGMDGFLSQWATLRAGPGAAAARVVLLRGGRLVLLVRAPDGSSVADVFAHVFDPVAKERGEDADDREAWERSDARGFVETRLLAGRYRVELERKVVGKPDTKAAADVELTEGGTTEIVVDLPE